MTPITPEERCRKIFDASIGCTSAAVDFLRSVNKPLNVSGIATTAWEIARKLEELMEKDIKSAEASPDGLAKAAPAHVQQVFNPNPTAPKPMPANMSTPVPTDELDLEPVPSGSGR